MDIFQTDNILLDIHELHQYLEPTNYSSSSGDSCSDLEPSITPVDIKPTFFDSTEPSELVTTDRVCTTPPDSCLVCGEPTKCCHYDVPSCSGCKTFFRRTIISGRTYSCKYNGTCDMKAKNQCRQCRFDQCILVGMNPAGIKLPENIALADVVQRIESRKRALIQDLEIFDATNLPPSSSNTPESMSVVPAKMASIKLPQVMEFRDVDFLMFLEMKVRKLRESTYYPNSDVPYTLQSLIHSRTELSNADRYGIMNGQQVTQQTFLANVKAREQQLAWPHPHPKHWSVVDIFLSIEMAKTMPIFEQLSYSDKEAFVLNATLCTAILTKSYYSYEMKSDTVVYPDGFMPVWLAKLRSKELNQLENVVFIRIIQPIKRIGLIKEEYVLLKAIIFCNPACSNISDAGQRLLEKESERYSKTLLRYMQSVHGAAKGASRYAQVIAIMEAMAYFADCHKQLHVLIMLHKRQMPPHHNKPPSFLNIIQNIMEF